jgi:hypothetical protein
MRALTRSLYTTAVRNIKVKKPAADAGPNIGARSGEPTLGSASAAEGSSVSARERTEKSFVDAERNATRDAGKDAGKLNVDEVNQALRGRK